MNKARILIVEDEAIIAMEVESQLQNLGYEVTSVVNTGENAIKKAEEDKPDLILMDIRIKGEMDGIGAAEVIRNKFGIPVVFSTAYLDQERIERAKITMPFGYVLKPIQERDLKVTLEMALYVAKVDADKKKADEENYKQKMLLENAESLANIGAWEWDIIEDKWFFSQQWLQIHGCGTVNLTTAELLLIGHPDDRKEIDKAFQNAVDDIKSYDVVHRIIRQSDGVERTVKSYGKLIKDEAGKPVKLWGAAHDITERIIAENTIKESEEKHRTLFETMIQGVVYQNAEGIIIDANPAAERILGLSLNQMQGKTSMDPRWKAIHEDGSDFPGDTHAISVALRTGKTIQNVIQGVYHPEKKEYRWISVNAVPKFRKGESTPYEAYAIFDDITDLRKGNK